jgi:hypothetical protein
MNLDDYNLIQVELQPGEKLLWSGRPNPKRMAWQLPNIIAVVFAIPFTLFAIFWMCLALLPMAAFFSAAEPSQMEGAAFSLCFPLFGLPFLLVGLVMLTAPYWAYRRALKMVYGLTDRRALILTTGKSISVKSYSDEDIDNIERTEQADGSGDLIFAREEYRRRGRRHTRNIAFIGIPNVRAVERLMLDTFKSEAL